MLLEDRFLNYKTRAVQQALSMEVKVIKVPMPKTAILPLLNLLQENESAGLFPNTERTTAIQKLELLVSAGCGR